MNPHPENDPPSFPLLPVERQPAGELKAIQTIVSALRGQLERRYVDHRQLVRRDAHPKHHGGLVRATFSVDVTCPRDLQHGIFVAGRSFPAMLRFSNGDPTVRHDLVPDIRGLAIKLTADVRPSMLDRIEHHDMLLATGEAFFGSDAVDYEQFPAASESIGKLLRYFIRFNKTRLRAGRRLLSGMALPASPLNPNYFSQVPYRLGPHCVKYLVRRRARTGTPGTPFYMRAGVRHVIGLVCAAVRSALPAKTSRRLPWPDALRRALIRDLSRHAVVLDVYVQPWQDLTRLPDWAIEDATRKWPGPYVKVATIEVPPQSATEICSRKDDAEHWSFHPWRVSPEHQPLGGIGRARREVYLEISRFRHSKNGRPPAP